MALPVFLQVIFLQSFPFTLSPLRVWGRKSEGETKTPIDRYLGKFERKDWAVSKIPALGEKREV